MKEFGYIAHGRQESTGAWIDVRNPYSGERVGRVAELDRRATLAVIERTAQTRLRLSRRERSNILDKMADRIDAERDAVSRMITDESGLSRKDTSYEVGRAIEVLRCAAIQALLDDSQVFPCDVAENGRARRIYTSREPLNLVAAITPFNHPLNQVVHKVAPAIATNNKILLKPSQLTPLSAHYLALLALDVGLPPDAFNVINGPAADVAETLVRSDAVEMVSFTGSTQVGRRIAALASYKRLVLELGGSSACLVLADADIDEAVQVAVRGVFQNSGQRCTAIRRLLVHDSIATEFVARLCERVKALRCGDPYDSSNDLGTLISESAAREVAARVDATLEAGAELVAGHRQQGACYAPTLLDHVRNEHPVVAEETFAPVASVIRFSSLDEAIRIANDTRYGLAGAVVSNHWPSIQKVVSELRVGTVNVNEAPSYRLEWSPFGGVKASGLGYKEGVIEAMRGMTWIKSYSLPWDAP